MAANGTDVFYSSSIVELVGTEKASKRLAMSSKAGTSQIFEQFLKKPAKPLLRKEGDMLIFEK